MPRKPRKYIKCEYCRKWFPVNLGESEVEICNKCLLKYQILLKEVKCPNCRKKKVQEYENNGKEWLCLSCHFQWKLTEEGEIIEL